MAFTIPKNIENTEKWWNIKYDSIFMLFFLLLIILWPIYWTNFVEIRSLKVEIQELKLQNKITETDKKSEQIFAQRINNLESKYIDVIASKDSINFWMTFLLVVFTVWIWWTWWSKRNFEKTAKEELKEITDAKEKALEKIENIDKIAEDKINEVKKQANEELKFIKSKFEELRKKQELADKNHIHLNNRQQEIENRLNIANKESKENKENKESINKNLKDYLNKGIEYHNAKKYEKAINEYNKALEIDSEYGEAHFQKWVTYYVQLDDKKALESFDRIDKKDDYFKNTHYFKWWIFKDNNENEQAKQEFIKDIKAFNSYTRSYYHLVFIYLKEDNIIETLKNLNKLNDFNYFDNQKQREYLYENKNFDKIREEKEFIKFVKKIKDKYWDK